MPPSPPLPVSLSPFLPTPLSLARRPPAGIRGFNVTLTHNASAAPVSAATSLAALPGLSMSYIGGELSSPGGELPPASAGGGGMSSTEIIVIVVPTVVFTLAAMALVTAGVVWRNKHQSMEAAVAAAVAASEKASSEKASSLLVRALVCACARACLPA